MNSLRTIARRLVASPILWVALGVSAAVALGSPAGHPRLGPEPAGWAANPTVPFPLFLEAGLEVKLVRDSFHAHAPALRPVEDVEHAHSLERSCPFQHPYRSEFAEFSPLYRRPPPSCS